MNKEGDIIVGQGIIGHAVEESEDRACSVKTNGSIKSKYAQYAFLQAMQDIELEIHSLNNTVMCVGDLTVMDPSGTKGTLSGGTARVGGKITCQNLGVDGDTATYVEAFVRYNKYKQGIRVGCRTSCSRSLSRAKLKASSPGWSVRDGESQSWW